MAHGTALIYDEEMTKYKLLWVDLACKIEVPERLSVSYEALVRNGLADRCVSIPVREATDAEILLVHSDEYLEAVKKTPYMTLEDLKEFTLQFGDVYFHPNIYHCAKLAAGSALQLVDSVMMERAHLVQKMGKNEVGSGLALVGDVVKAMMCVVQHVSPDLNRVLVVCVGNGKIPSHISRDGKVLVLQISSDVSEEQQSKYYISVCLQKGCCNTSGFMQAVLGLLLPVGYEYNPDLVVLVRVPDSGVCDVVWKQLTGLLQSFAKGHTLVLMQEKENSCVGPTASILLGDPAPPLGTLQAPDREDVDAVERLRHRLQADWKLLQTTSEYTSGAVQH
uniref:Histone deacetylase 10 n=1 Tax=Nothobranchius pienaari TaxID=704102 RepID=A0A1A8N9U2_9TELE